MDKYSLENLRKKIEVFEYVSNVNFLDYIGNYIERKEFLSWLLGKDYIEVSKFNFLYNNQNKSTFTEFLISKDLNLFKYSIIVLNDISPKNIIFLQKQGFPFSPEIFDFLEDEASQQFIYSEIRQLLLMVVLSYIVKNDHLYFEVEKLINL